MQRNFDELALPGPATTTLAGNSFIGTDAVLVSKHENCLVPPCMNLINPDIRMLRSLTPVAQTGSTIEIARAAWPY